MKGNLCLSPTPLEPLFSKEIPEFYRANKIPKGITMQLQTGEADLEIGLRMEKCKREGSGKQREHEGTLIAGGQSLFS